MTLEEYIEDYERQVSQKDKLLKQIEKDQPEKRTLTVKRLTESMKYLETMLGFLKELKEYRDAGREDVERYWEIVNQLDPEKCIETIDKVGEEPPETFTTGDIDRLFEIRQFLDAFEVFKNDIPKEE